VPPTPDDLTALLGRASAGDPAACADLFRRVAADLRPRAHALLRGRRRGDPALQTTALIDDAFLKLVGDRRIAWQDRAQFYRLAAHAMRQVLVDHARRRQARKRRPGGRPVPLEEVADLAAPAALGPLDRLALDEALSRLARHAPELAEVVELHHFGGWDLKQVAQEILGVSYQEARVRWQLARAWLYRALGSEGDRDGP
jgi:RNA polymerase sigma factor (TIGR02999 family)